MPQEPRSPSPIPAPPRLNSVAPAEVLGRAGQSLWDRVQTEYGIEDAAGVELLTGACVATDRAAEFAAVVARDGAMLQGKDGPRPHPAVRGELEARAFVLKTLRELGLTTQSVKAVGRPAGVPRGQNANRSFAAATSAPWESDR
jgi:Phage terminase, small subunit